MDTAQRKSLTTTRMIAQFYMDISKYLLMILLAFGLFDKSTQGTITRPALIIIALIGLLWAAIRAQCSMDRIDEEEKKEAP